MRLLFGLQASKRNAFGIDFSGVVEEARKGVTAFNPGDEVYGMCGITFAEYLCAPASDIALKPMSLAPDLATAVPLAGLTALQGLLDCGRVRPEQRVVIIGASSGVGDLRGPACQAPRRACHWGLRHEEPWAGPLARR